MPASDVHRHGRDCPGHCASRVAPCGTGPACVAGRRLTPYLLIAVPAAFLLVFFVIPSAVLLSMSVVQSEDTIPTGNLTLDNYATLLSNRLYLSAILRSFIVGIASGVIVVLLAYPLAYFLVRTTSRWKNLLIALSLAPLLASVIVRTYGWWVVLNREGALNVALRSLGVIDQPLIMLPSTVGHHHRPGARTAALWRAHHHGLAERRSIPASNAPR